jgi:hypothetical protein
MLKNVSQLFKYGTTNRKRERRRRKEEARDGSGLYVLEYTFTEHGWAIPCLS